MPTIAQIAKLAFDGVARGIPDAIHSATLKWTVQGAYDYDTGTYATVPVSDSGRVVEDQAKPIRDVFEDYTVGPSDTLILMEGFTTIPKEGWGLEYAGKARTIKRVQDIAAAGSLFYVIAI